MISCATPTSYMIPDQTVCNSSRDAPAISHAVMVALPLPLPLAPPVPVAASGALEALVCGRHLRLLRGALRCRLGYGIYCLLMLTTLRHLASHVLIVVNANDRVCPACVANGQRVVMLRSIAMGFVHQQPSSLAGALAFAFCKYHFLECCVD